MGKDSNKRELREGGRKGPREGEKRGRERGCAFEIALSGCFFIRGKDCR